MVNRASILGYLILFALNLLFVSNAVAVDKVRLTAIIDYPPYLMRKSELRQGAETVAVGQDSTLLQGYSWDVVREAFHSQGIVIELTVAPWARTMKMVKGQKADLVISMTKNRQRQQWLDFSQWPVNEIKMTVFYSAKRPLNWQGLDSLSGKRIAVIRGFSYGNRFDRHQHIIKVPISTPTQGFGLLEKGRVDGFVGNKEVNTQFLRREGWEDQYLTTPVFANTMEYMAGVKGSTRVKRLLAFFDKGMTELQDRHRLIQLKQKWQLSEAD